VVSEQLFGRLKAPVKRVAAPRIPISYAPPLEDEVRVSAARIMETARTMIAG
jgi:pyruvate dehydrogenase E1 component beta subunit